MLHSDLQNFDIYNKVDDKVRQVIQDCKYFSLSLGESTDVTDFGFIYL